ncbi:carbohydrate ABC transporter permease [Cohnella herbarum]|uniref:Carbohydrate ABC transporter permease n=1 Tax=Cohnella herbarum TaxID=2728023 RepID=A0A7Z2VJX9_9BACL|nr:carbohydrate ABC transporter permease [Cohnella herbarum]QJD84568.1 carbohydrate ABC transporter permease [Cohnella herbarum]
MTWGSKRNWFDWVNGAVMVLICIGTIYPFLYILNISLSSPVAANQTGLHLWPEGFRLTAYRGIWEDRHFLRSYVNIVAVTAIGTFLGLLVSACAAYTLSRKRFPFRKSVLGLLTVTIVFNGGLIPYYLVVRQLNLIDTWIPLWLPVMTGVFNIIILKNFFLAVPQELEESAKIDGATDFRVFGTIIVPLSKPVLATVGLWLAVQLWNDWFSPYLFINSPDKVTLPLVLRKYVVENDLTQVGSFARAIAQVTEQPTSTQIVSAVIIVSILPMLVAYPYIQRFFVKGILFGSIKE